jgi:hypothetical protein
LRQLFDDGGLTRRRKFQTDQPPSDLLFPFRHLILSVKIHHKNHKIYKRHKIYLQSFFVPFVSFYVFFVVNLSRYSHRSAASGSTFVARRAGIQQANNATNVSNITTAMNVSGSVALTP